MSQTEQLNKCEAERKYLHKVYEEAKEKVAFQKEVSETLQKELDIEHTRYIEEAIKRSDLEEENKQLKGFINSLMTEDQKDICNGEAMELGEQTLQTPEDWIDRIRQFLEERDELADKLEDLEEENKELKEELKVTQEVEIDGLCGYKTQIAELKEELEAEKFYSQQLKDCNYEEYCEYVSENKLIKEFEDLKNELGELKEQLKKV